jgi:hypothetical protein
MTAELAHQIAYNLVTVNWAKQCREVLESFFGGPMPLPDPGTSPDTIFRLYSDMRTRAIESGEHPGNLPEDLKSKLRLDSPALVTRIVLCRAEAASVLRDTDRREWWLTAMDLYDAFISIKNPRCRLERICAFDLNRIRDRRT